MNENGDNDRESQDSKLVTTTRDEAEERERSSNDLDSDQSRASTSSRVSFFFPSLSLKICVSKQEAISNSLLIPLQKLCRSLIKTASFEMKSNAHTQIWVKLTCVKFQ